MAIKIDVAVIKANGATKPDIAQLGAAILEAKTAIVMWGVGVMIVGQVLPAILKVSTR